MRKLLIALVFVGLFASGGKVWADYLIKQGDGTTTSTVLSFICQTTKLCPAQVLIDSSGNEKGVSANPVYTAPVQDVRPSSGTLTVQDTGSTSTAGQNSASIITGTPTANSVVSQAINGQAIARVQLSGTWTGTLAFEGSVDSGTTWVAQPARVTGTSYTGGTATANGLFLIDSSGLTNVRVRSTASMTGTATVTFTFANNPGAVQVINPVRIFDNVSGNQATVDGSGRLIVNCGTGCGGSGGTASNFGSAFPTPGTAVGFTDGTNMVAGKVIASGSDTTSNTNAELLTGSFGYFYNGTTWDRVRGDTTNGLWVNIKSSVLPTGAATAANQTGGNQQTQITDGTNGSAAIKPASTAAAATDKSLVTNESPNSQLSTAAGTTADSAYAGSGNSSIVAALKGVYSQLTSLISAVQSAIPAGTNVIGKVGIDQTTPGTTNGVQINAAVPAGTNTIGNVNGAPNITATDCSGSITTGGTAQNAFAAQTALHGFTIVNIDTTEPLWISFTGTAAASGTGSYPLQAATATTFASPGSFTTPMGFGLNHALSVIAVTTSHKFSCTWW